ncbi:unnamed protein product [Effrenium voratum]|uniref:Uncharacterized protein n=1 Tax=Effrenium voratum TaxID=2562239 RepID=A0AA36I5M8_9DINO|nr:unnamed protein product [Effrenium voratum]
MDRRQERGFDMGRELRQLRDLQARLQSEENQAQRRSREEVERSVLRRQLDEAAALQDLLSGFHEEMDGRLEQLASAQLRLDQRLTKMEEGREEGAELRAVCEAFLRVEGSAAVAARSARSRGLEGPLEEFEDGCGAARQFQRVHLLGSRAKRQAERQAGAPGLAAHALRGAGGPQLRGAGSPPGAQGGAAARGGLQAEGRASELEQRAAHEADAVRKAAEAMEAAAFSRCQRTGELLDQFRQEVSQEEQSARESVLELRKQAEEAGPRLAGLEARLREELQLAAGRADHFAEKSAEKAAEKLEELQRRLNAELRTVQDQAQEQRAAQEALEELQQETSECLSTCASRSGLSALAQEMDERVASCQALVAAQPWRPELELAAEQLERLEHQERLHSQEVAEEAREAAAQCDAAWKLQARQLKEELQRTQQQAAGLKALEKLQVEHARLALQLSELQRQGASHEWHLPRLQQRLEYLSLDSPDAQGVWIDSPEFRLAEQGPFTLRFYPRGVAGGDGLCALGVFAAAAAKALPLRLDLRLGQLRQRATAQSQEDGVLWLARGFESRLESLEEVRIGVDVPPFAWASLDQEPEAPNSLTKADRAAKVRGDACLHEKETGSASGGAIQDLQLAQASPLRHRSVPSSPQLPCRAVAPPSPSSRPGWAVFADDLSERRPMSAKVARVCQPAIPLPGSGRRSSNPFEERRTNPFDK